MANLIEQDAVVTLTYVLTDADTGEELDRTTADRAFGYLHGHQNIVKGLEAALAGKAVGHAFDVTLEAADAYGERTGPGPQAVKRSQFRRDARLEKGMRFKAKGSDGKEVILFVTDVRGSRVYVDSEHPMVGRRLRFVGTVDAIRDAEPVEIEHGHAHIGHHHH